jgi:hypothetical protein
MDEAGFLELGHDAPHGGRRDTEAAFGGQDVRGHGLAILDVGSD